MIPEASLALIRHPVRTRSAAWFCQPRVNCLVFSRTNITGSKVNAKPYVTAVKIQDNAYSPGFSRYSPFAKPVIRQTAIGRAEYDSPTTYTLDVYCYGLCFGKDSHNKLSQSRSNYTMPILNQVEGRFRNSRRSRSLPDFRCNTLLKYIERPSLLWDAMADGAQPIRYNSTFIRLGETLSSVLRATYTNIRYLQHALQSVATRIRSDAKLYHALNRSFWETRASNAHKRCIPLGPLADEAGVIDSPTIRTNMTIAEVASILRRHCCKHLNRWLPISSCSRHPIATGGFGDIYLGKLENGKPVAVKVARYLTNSMRSRKQIKNTAKELHTWAKCQHPNILPLLGIIEFQDQIAMVSPWMNNGDLRTYLLGNPKADRCQLCYDICEGLVYLHSMNIIHGDLKGANVLISENGEAMLNDFGNSLVEDNTMRFTATTRDTACSSRWAAPEILEGAPVSYPADVFALGMTLLEAITGDIPYRELEREQAVMAAILFKKAIPIRPTAYIPHKSTHGDFLWSLFTGCWAYEPINRPRAEEVRDMMLQVTKTGLIHQVIVDSITKVRPSCIPTLGSHTWFQPELHRTDTPMEIEGSRIGFIIVDALPVLLGQISLYNSY